jgi:hypothetical protein
VRGCIDVIARSTEQRADAQYRLLSFVLIWSSQDH